MVVQIEAIEDAPRFRWIEVGIHPLPQTARVEAEVEVGGDPDVAKQPGIQTREDREATLVLEEQIQVRQVVPEQVHIATPHDEAQQRRWIFQNRNREVLFGWRLLALRGRAGGERIAVEPFLIRSGQNLLLTRRQCAVVFAFAGGVCCTQVCARILRRGFSQMERAQIDVSGRGQFIDGVQKLNRTVQDLEHFGHRIDDVGRQPQPRDINKPNRWAGDASHRNFHQQQIDNRLERRHDVLNGAQCVPEEALEQTSDIDRNVFKNHIRAAEFDAGFAVRRQRDVTQHLCVMYGCGNRRQEVACRGLHTGNQMGLSECGCVHRQRNAFTDFPFSVAVSIANIQTKMPPQTGFLAFDGGFCKRHLQETQRSRGG